MGRKKIYLTPESKLEATRKIRMNFYWRNAKRIRKENLERYYDKKYNSENNKRNLQDSK